MNDAFGKVVAILIGAYLMFIAPVMYTIEETNVAKIHMCLLLLLSLWRRYEIPE